MNYKPEGFNSVSPYLIIEEPQATLDFLHAVFGCEPFGTHRDEHGNIRHTQVRIGDSIVMIGGATGGAGAHVHIYIEDVETKFKVAKQAGGTVVQELAVQSGGERRCGIMGPGGTTWWLSQHQRKAS